MCDFGLSFQIQFPRVVAHVRKEHENSVGSTLPPHGDEGLSPRAANRSPKCPASSGTDADSKMSGCVKLRSVMYGLVDSAI